MRTLFFAALAILGLATGAVAGPNVPDVSVGQLPVAGTCAPIPSTNVTWVTVGEPGWYRIDADPRDIEGAELATVLKGRGMFASQASQDHDVWIVTRGDRDWGQIVNVLRACQEGGLHRVGIQVRSEADGRTYGFPLFLPHGRNAPEPPGPRPSAHRLDIRINTEAADASDPHRLHAAAKVAVQQFPPVVAEMSVSVRTRVQDAVTAIDMLYRAGCAAVRMKFRLMVRSLSGPSVPQIWVQERLLPPEPLDTRPQPVAPRAAPWSDDGAAQAGAHRFELIPIPTGSAGAGTRSDDLRPLPSYAAEGRSPPPEAVADAAASIRQWSAALGGWLVRILTQPRVSVPETLVVKRRRQWQGVQQMFDDARRAFGTATEVRPATLRVQAYLLRGQRLVGKVDATLGLAGSGVDVVFANWIVEEFPTDLVLPPVETEPFAAGVPGHLRVWIEGLLTALKAEGPAAVPLASGTDVLSELPPVAHPGVLQALQRRQPAIDALAGWLRATPYDRVFIAFVDGQAGVHAADGRVIGVLRYDLQGEMGNLSLANLTARVAPR